MKYLCMVYVEEKTLESLPKSEYQALVDETLELVEELRHGGNYIAAEPLEPVATAATVQVRGGKVAVTDGPFAETKEQLGGFFLLEARDLNEAIRLASRIPPARVGRIEVRAVRHIEHSREPEKFPLNRVDPAARGSTKG
jgi:hypothetical protein